MRVFDRIDNKSLDSRELQLWVLAISMIMVLSIGIALLMFPMAYSHPVDLTGLPARAIFFGFCGLSALLICYFVDRQLVIRQLRVDLDVKVHQVERIRREASADLLNTIPGLTIFRDRLAMEHRRAANVRQPLSLVTVQLHPSNALAGTGEVEIAFGDAAKTLVAKLRGEDALFLLSPGIFAVVLPGASTSDADLVRNNIVEGLHDAAGVSSRFTFSVSAVNYPEQASTAREMEGYVQCLLPKDEDFIPEPAEQLLPA